MGRILQYLLMVAALGFVWVGLEHARALQRMLVPASWYERTPGSVLMVQAVREDNPGHGEVPGFSRWLYEVHFTYSADGRRYQAHTLSPLCESCEADEVRRVTGRAPAQLAPRTPLTVYVRRGQPEVAYLTLASAGQIARQGAMTLLWLLIVPAALLVMSRAELSESDAD